MAGYQRQGSASTSNTVLKSAVYKDQFNIDAGTLRIQAKNASEAAKAIYKEQKNIVRKQNKTKKSRELPTCIEKFQTELMELNVAVDKMKDILSEEAGESGFATPSQSDYKRKRASSYHAPKDKKRRALNEPIRAIQTDCLHCLNKEETIKTLNARLKSIENENEDSLKQLIRSNEELQQRYETEKQHLERLQRKYQEEIQAKEDALRRLSAVTSSKLRDNNPNITDLSDQNRPTKIAEKLSELYDNQWTDAFDSLEGQIDDRRIIPTLLDTLMDVYYECRRLSSENFFETVQRSIELPAEATGIPQTKLVIPAQLRQQIKEFRKTRATTVVKDIEKILKQRIQLPKQQTTEMQDYISSCVEIGWLCAVQDPPLILNAHSPHEFDTNAFKDYTKRGKYVEYVVWPAMYLNEGGALLAKGVAQGIDHKPTSTRGYAEHTQVPRQNISVQATSAQKTPRNQGGQRHHPPIALPDQQRQNSHLQSDGFSSSKIRMPGNTQKSQTMYSTRRTTEMNASQTVYGRRGYAVGTASHSTDF